MKIGLRHVGLIVNDAEKALKFYHGLLGFIPKADQIESDKFFQNLVGIKGAKARTIKCYSSFDNSCIELIEYIFPTAKNRIKNLNSKGFNHIALNVDNIDRCYSDLIEVGIKFLSKPTNNNSNSARVAFCVDFEGNYIELVQII